MAKTMKQTIEDLNVKLEGLARDHRDICCRLEDHTKEHEHIVDFMENSKPIFDIFNNIINAFKGADMFIVFIKHAFLKLILPAFFIWIIYEVAFGSTVNKLMMLINNGL